MARDRDRKTRVIETVGSNVARPVGLQGREHRGAARFARPWCIPHPTLPRKGGGNDKFSLPPCGGGLGWGVGGADGRGVSWSEGPCPTWLPPNHQHLPAEDPVDE